MFIFLHLYKEPLAPALMQSKCNFSLTGQSHLRCVGAAALLL